MPFSRQFGTGLVALALLGASLVTLPSAGEAAPSEPAAAGDDDVIDADFTVG